MVTLFFSLLTVLALSYSGQAATLEWDANLESDMKDYRVYACFTAGCTLAKTPAMLQPSVVPHPPVGTKPSLIIDLSNKQGSIGVTARDQNLNESGLSVSLPFDQAPPLIPVNPMLR